MPWLDKHKTAWRIALLVLLAVSFAGPWYYSSDGVPPAEWCRDPLVLLENGRCVRLVSGAFLGLTMAAFFPVMVADVLRGAETFAGRGREFLGAFLFALLALAIIQPVVTTLLAMLRRSRRAGVYNIVAWGLALALSIVLAVSAPSELLPRLWGLWLYVAVAVAGLALEWALLRAQRLLN